MNKEEAKLQGLVTRWLRVGEGKEWIEGKGWSGCGFELKVDRGKGRISFSEVVGEKRVHQAHELWRVRHELLSHKIDDSGIGYKPFDMVVICRGGAGYIMGFEGCGAWFVEVEEVVREGFIDGDIEKGGRKGGSFSFEWVEGVGERLEGIRW